MIPKLKIASFITISKFFVTTRYTGESVSARKLSMLLLLFPQDACYYNKSNPLGVWQIVYHKFAWPEWSQCCESQNTIFLLAQAKKRFAVNQSRLERAIMDEADSEYTQDRHSRMYRIAGHHKKSSIQFFVRIIN